ncbi:MAG: YdcF family protein [Erysipelotrichaceae bacterium]|nr:YdcF family protein [Erysipelotrichaceae bacterium]
MVFLREFVIIALFFFNEYLISKVFRRDNLYSYNNIMFYAVSLFNFLLLLPYLTVYAGDISKLTVADILRNCLITIEAVNLMVVPLIFLGFIPIIISNLALVKKEGARITNLLGIVFLGFVFLGLFGAYTLPMILTDFGLQIENAAFTQLLFEYSMSYIIVYFECVFLGTVISSLRVIYHQPAYDKDYVIILGCQIMHNGRLTNLLRGRVDRAIRFVNEQKEKNGRPMTYVPSGGQGYDETTSEAEAIESYLMKNGISAGDIIIENHSRSTLENITYSMDLIKKDNPNAKVIFATTNYHLFRAGLIANKAGYPMEGIGSKTKWYFFPNAFLREFAGVITEWKWKHLAVALSFFLFTCIVLYII